MLPRSTRASGYAAVVRAVASILCGLGALTAASCGPNYRAGDPSGPSDPAITPAAWPYTPATIRVHPLSRIVPSTDGSAPRLAEVRVQCNDLEGDATRTIGTLWLRLGTGEQARIVECDLGDAKVNRECWDPVTRTYRLTLPLPEGFVCTPGAALAAQARLRLDHAKELEASGSLACP